MICNSFEEIVEQIKNTFPPKTQIDDNIEVAIRKIAHAVAHPESKHLALNGVNLSLLQHLPKEVIDGLKHIESISMQECGIDKVPQWIFELSNLKSLDLSHNRLTYDAISNFASDTLEDLKLSGNEIRGIPRSLVTNLPALRSLQVENCKIEHMPLDNIFELENLEYLILRSNCIREIPESALAMIQQQERLLKVDVSQNLLDPSTMEHLPEKVRI